MKALEHYLKKILKNCDCSLGFLFQYLDGKKFLLFSWWQKMLFICPVCVCHLSVVKTRTQFLAAWTRKLSCFDNVWSSFTHCSFVTLTLVFNIFFNFIITWCWSHIWWMTFATKMCFWRMAKGRAKKEGLVQLFLFF